jgi:hypothetical protein
MALLDEIKALDAITELPRGQKALVFYSEGPEYWPHFRGLLRELLITYRCPFLYIASSAEDPGLRIRDPLVRTFQIGQGGARVNLFKSLAADIMVLTMPDLARLTLPRSPDCRHYVYVFHSPVSTHMIYRDGAFDHYDTIFCVGPHHHAEIRRREEMAGLPAKRLFHHGYGRLDELLQEEAARDRGPSHASRIGQVLLAPSWGPFGILETIGESVVSALLDAGHRVVVRPHPQTMRLSRRAIDDLQARFATHERFMLETDMASKESFFASDVVVSDWSGAALEFAFARLRPVVFVDTPRKVNNPEWELHGLDPLEAEIRPRIGAVVPPGDQHALTAAVAAAIRDGAGWSERIRAERDRWIFNVGQSSRAGARELARMTFNAALGDDGKPEDLDARCHAFAASKLAVAEGGSSAGSLVSLLDRLLKCDDDFDVETLQHLEALCRPIDVLKRLNRDYDDRFRKALPGSPVAEAAVFPAMAYVLIRAARGIGPGQPDLALKFLNTAGNVLNANATVGGAAGAAAFESLLARTTDEI